MSKHIVTVLGCTIAAGLCASPALAQSSAQNLPNVEVQQKKHKPAKAKRPAPPEASASRPSAEPADAQAAYERRGLTAPLSGGVIQGERLEAERAATSDTVSMLRAIPGVNFYTAGGVSSLPDIHGLNDDRINATLNGMAIVSACANHMNPALSYVDPRAIKKIEVMAGISPVSAGGDSLGSVVAVETAAPAFASGDRIVTHGSVGAYAHSNGDKIGGSASASAASSYAAVSYTGAWSRSNDYVDAHGDKVESTMYEAQNHALSLAMRGSSDLLMIDAGFQKIPYQGYPNQWMDMTGNEAWFVNGRYETKTDWGKLYLQAYYQHTDHMMEFLEDKKIGRTGPPKRMADMPMLTDGENMGYKVKAEIPVSRSDMLRVGNELQRHTLDDWWPPVMNTAGPGGTCKPGMMACDTFWNINGGERTVLGTFAELESKWSKEWTTLVGVRNDTVWMNTGAVQGYSAMMYGADADKFNKKDHAKTDINFGVTAQARYEQDANSIYEFGLARKTRSPNLDERYTWSTNGMAMAMIGWFGDSNRYVGDIDLKPETANTASFTAAWHDAARRDWQIKVTPYYTYVEDYIGVKSFGLNAGVGPYGLLRFTNLNAELYGADVSGSKLLVDSLENGRLTLTGILNYTHGRDLDTGNPLYHIMPLNARIGLEHKLGHWTNVAELNLVAEKTLVDPVRLEPKTAGYALVNLRSSYELENIRFDFGVENLFNQYYEPPLGGTYIGGFIPGKGPATGPGGLYGAVPGMGRNVYAGVTFKF